MIENHPLEPFIVEDAVVLMLGSFPPKREKWSMEFYYPNFINDMWRIFGLGFFEDKNYFLKDARHFDKEKIQQFLCEKKIAVADAAQSVFRKKNNASDSDLQIKCILDFNKILQQLPKCQYLMTTGEKSAQICSNFFNISTPKVNKNISFTYMCRSFYLYRLPSSSRAYPLALEKKAAAYRNVFTEIGLIGPA
ncbi:G/U mismatch-specific uracil-DNA glycosylase [Brevinema andersonii]|uniref:G/U mismatch-specific uracil-DNA glycosylase n=1 Tax=Brevinema andersonii TaxID=34097 RepID=A0A1I1CYS1_BREAD|nr:uracil-DNA glycosylase family protein [Brevinema andersonii]SFB67242.1 G/U mismatch-specific uracil-DNA glycosylase [Brevinema andersonii]